MMKLFFAMLCLLLSVSFSQVNAKEITRIKVSDFGGDIEKFYKEYAHEPVIVEEAYSDNEFLKTLTLEQVEEYFKGKVLFGYNRKNDATGRIRESIPSEVFFADFKDGSSQYYVFDHELSESPFAGKVSIPAFIDENWLTDDYGFNITLTGKGSFTPFHEDGSGEQAWMYLVAGEKLWDIYPPSCRPLLWDSLYKDFFHPKKSDPSRYPYLACAENDKITATARGGDLIFLPPGWIHQVLTTESSFGVGGNMVNEFQIYQSVETGLNEKSHALRHDFDLLELAKEKVGHTRTEYGMGQLEKALELAREWDLRIRDKSDGLQAKVAGTGSPESEDVDPSSTSQTFVGKAFEKAREWEEQITHHVDSWIADFAGVSEDESPVEDGLNEFVEKLEAAAQSAGEKAKEIGNGLGEWLERVFTQDQADAEVQTTTSTSDQEPETTI